MCAEIGDRNIHTYLHIYIYGQINLPDRGMVVLNGCWHTKEAWLSLKAESLSSPNLVLKFLSSLLILSSY